MIFPSRDITSLVVPHPFLPIALARMGAQYRTGGVAPTIKVFRLSFPILTPQEPISAWEQYLSEYETAQHRFGVSPRDAEPHSEINHRLVAVDAEGKKIGYVICVISP